MTNAITAGMIPAGAALGSEMGGLAHHGAYLPHIDGLRAIAILLVVGFHAGIPYLTGGFIGVDVFFVISGYLITGLLARELAQTGRIDILDFYARRARRLLPALAVVLLATLAGGAVLLLPFGEQQGLAKSAIAASGFLANIFFWRTRSDYFAGPSDEIPLLHLWTLAVEEQFYFVWPLLMMLVAGLAVRRGGNSLIRTLIVALMLASLVSFAGCVYFTPQRLVVVFYNMPFRAWEFGVGAILALLFVRKTKNRVGAFGAGILALIGVGAIVFAGLTFDKSTLFPGYNAAMPVLGSGALIFALALAPGSIVGRALASPPIAGVGKLSYSWYLWHWPLLALARANAVGENSLVRDVALVGVALVLSGLTYFFIEEPIRRRKPWPVATSASSAFAGIALMLTTAAGAGMLWGSAEARLQHDPLFIAVSKAQEDVSITSSECGYFRYMFQGLAPVEKCVLGRRPFSPMVLLWGDSHARALIPAFSEWISEKGSVLPRAFGACKPYMVEPDQGLETNFLNGARNCAQFNSAVLDELDSLGRQGLTTVILAARWSVLSSLQTGFGNWQERLEKIVGRIRAKGFRVLLVVDAPNPRQSVPGCLGRHGIDACGRSRREVEQELADVKNAFRHIQDRIAGVRVVDFTSSFCDAENCKMFRDGIVVYSDDNHPAASFVRKLSRQLSYELFYNAR